MRFIWLAVLLVAFMSAPGIVRASECTDTMSVADLIKRAEAMQPRIYQATPAGLDKLLTYMNKNRAARGLEPVDADLFMAAFFKDGRIGIALAKGGCVIPKLVFSIDAPMFGQIMGAAGMEGADLEPSKQGAGA